MKTRILAKGKCLAALAVIALASCTTKQEAVQTMKFFAGSSKGSLSHSIYLCELSPGEETFALIDSFSGAKAGSYLDLSPDNKYLYSISQTSLDKESEMASVCAFMVDPGSRSLKFINSQPSEGADICHIHCSKNGKYIFAANYGSGHATALPVRENGEIGAASSVQVGEGNGPVVSRQQGPHAHQVMLDPGQNYLLVPDLGTDKIMIYAFDAEKGELVPNPAQTFFQLAPGAGPRHLDFHPDGNSLYIVNELNSTITACNYNGKDGTITEVNTLSTVEADHQGMKYPAAVRTHPNGRFVYASTRGKNSCISTFEINPDKSLKRLQVTEHVPNWPRDFNLDPSGNWMLVAGERSDEIRLYKVDPENGMITETETTVTLPAPASILFVE